MTALISAMRKLRDRLVTPREAACVDLGLSLLRQCVTVYVEFRNPQLFGRSAGGLLGAHTDGLNIVRNRLQL